MMKAARITCIVCGSTNLKALIWIHVRGVPPGEPAHNTVYDYSGMLVCQACGYSQLEKFSHDCWSHDEDWDMYWWYVLNPNDTKSLDQLLAVCPNTLDAGCMCPMHVSLRHSAERLYAGVQHVCYPEESTGIGRLVLEVQAGIPNLSVDDLRPVGEMA